MGNLPPKKQAAPIPAVTRTQDMKDEVRDTRQKSVLLREVAHQRQGTLAATARDTEAVMGKLLFWRRG